MSIRSGNVLLVGIDSAVVSVILVVAMCQWRTLVAALLPTNKILLGALPAVFEVIDADALGLHRSPFTLPCPMLLLLKSPAHQRSCCWQGTKGHDKGPVWGGSKIRKWEKNVIVGKAM
jgi:hypothetical protein